MTSPAGRASRIPVWVLVAVFWGLLSVIYATPIALMTPRMSERAMRIQIAWQTVYYLAWAPLTLLIWKVTRRWDPERLGWTRFALFHTAFALAVSLGHSATVVSVGVNLTPPASEPTMEILTGYIRGRLHMQLLIYAAVVGTGQAIGYYNHYRERQVAAAKLEAQLVAARLDTLRAQLQPHFLFNSLHSIASLARAGDTAGVVRLISGFSDLLRNLLDSNLTHHAIGEELALVDRYLDIQRVRFGDRLRVTIDATPEASTARVPLLVVQPLVENALRHGFAPRVAPGHVAIRARRDGPWLEIDVTDDGVGLPEGWSLASCAGTGLRNLQARLAGEFGDDHRLLVSPRQEGGVAVTVRIPFAPA